MCRSASQWGTQFPQLEPQPRWGWPVKAGSPLHPRLPSATFANTDRRPRSADRARGRNSDGRVGEPHPDLDRPGRAAPGARRSIVQAATLDEIKRLGGDVAKVTLDWRRLAPAARASPQASWATTRRSTRPRAGCRTTLVRAAQARGMRVMFLIGGHAPDWASGKGRSGTVRPIPPSSAVSRRPWAPATRATTCRRRRRPAAT